MADSTHLVNSVADTTVALALSINSIWKLRVGHSSLPCTPFINRLQSIVAVVVIITMTVVT